MGHQQETTMLHSTVTSLDLRDLLIDKKRIFSIFVWFYANIYLFFSLQIERFTTMQKSVYLFLLTFTYFLITSLCTVLLRFHCTSTVLPHFLHTFMDFHVHVWYMYQKYLCSHINKIRELSYSFPWCLMFQFLIFKSLVTFSCSIPSPISTF